MNFKGTSPTDSSRPKCGVCDNPPSISFSWQYAREHRDHHLNTLFNQLKYVKPLKFGTLYSCRLCGLNWVLDDGGVAARRVPAERLNILNEWNENKLAIEDKHIHVLDAIGGTAQKHWIGNDLIISIPCAISTTSGERIDPAIIWITKRPPIDDFTTRIRLYRNIEASQPSRFALPLAVRHATINAPEVSMGFSPTRVEANNGTPFILHWSTSLFNQDGITGSDIRLSRKSFRADEDITIAKADMDHATYFIADWFEGAEKLDKARSDHINGTKISMFWNRLFHSPT